MGARQGMTKQSEVSLNNTTVATTAASVKVYKNLLNLPVERKALLVIN
jgi:hypothetical protein